MTADSTPRKQFTIHLQIPTCQTITVSGGRGVFPTMPICPQRYGTCLQEGCHGTFTNSVGSHPMPPLLSGMPDDVPFETLCGWMHSGQVCKNPEVADLHYAETACVLFLERLRQLAWWKRYCLAFSATWLHHCIYPLSSILEIQNTLFIRRIVSLLMNT